MELEDINVMIVINGLVQKDDPKDQKNLFLKNIFINVKLFKIYQINITKLSNGFTIKLNSMNQMQKHIIQNQ